MIQPFQKKFCQLHNGYLRLLLRHIAKPDSPAIRVYKNILRIKQQLFRAQQIPLKHIQVTADSHQQLQYLLVANSPSLIQTRHRLLPGNLIIQIQFSVGAGPVERQQPRYSVLLHHRNTIIISDCFLLPLDHQIIILKIPLKFCFHRLPPSLLRMIPLFFRIQSDGFSVWTCQLFAIFS